MRPSISTTCIFQSTRPLKCWLQLAFHLEKTSPKQAERTWKPHPRRPEPKSRRVYLETARLKRSRYSTRLMCHMEVFLHKPTASFPISAAAFYCPVCRVLPNSLFSVRPLFAPRLFAFFPLCKQLQFFLVKLHSCLIRYAALLFPRRRHATRRPDV